MFSKALFKQSCKANWIKWLAVTVATSVMLAIVIIVLGNLGINNIRDSLKDIFTQSAQQSELQENAIKTYNNYNLQEEGYALFESNKSKIEEITTSYDENIAGGDDISKAKATSINAFLQREDLSIPNDKIQLFSAFLDTYLINYEKVKTVSYSKLDLFQGSYTDLMTKMAVEGLLKENALATEEEKQSVAYFAHDLASNMFNNKNQVDIYQTLNDNSSTIVNGYDSLINLLHKTPDEARQEVLSRVGANPAIRDLSPEMRNLALRAVDNFLVKYEAKKPIASQDKNRVVSELIDAEYETFYNTLAQAQIDALDDENTKNLEEIKVDMKKYADGNLETIMDKTNHHKNKTLALNYTNNLMYMQAKITFADDSKETRAQYSVTAKISSNTAIVTYNMLINDGFTHEKAMEETTKSFQDQIPENVSQALNELGEMDMYGFMIGSIFYRIAGLLLPMVFVIMVSNGLLAGQVDSGSMAYVLSTPTKRRAVTVTQLTFLILSLLSMFSILTVVSVIAVWVSGGNAYAINYGQILLFNLGAFLTMFAIAGYCFMCSSLFNRTKHSLAIGGGLTIFSLVCTILGLFGSKIVPTAMRVPAMNFFNFLSVITLFDTVSILNGTTTYLWKFAILAVIGIVTFIVGVFRFDKKDLPL